MIGAAAICVLVGVVYFLCRGGPKTEDEILANIEEQAYILVEDERMDLDVTSLEIEKRKSPVIRLKYIARFGWKVMR